MDEVWEYQEDYEIQAMVEHVAEKGGEYNFKTVKGEVKDVHYSPPEGRGACS